MKQEQEIFEQAMALFSQAAREEYLSGACGQNRELRKCVDELLAAFDDAGALDFLQTGDRSQKAQTVVADTRLDEGPGTLIGRYKLLQKIGEGGMGVVYMAEQEEPVRRRVALKVIKLGMDTKSVVARFEAERQALALMDHPNIAKVLDGGATDAGRPYFVMELVRGVKITEYCDEARLSTRERLDLFIQVCQAIQHAHQKGIIHRDIKPSNIFVTINDGVAVPKVIDFGIAKATEGRLTDKTVFTQFEALLGTPAYMSPEQALMTSLDIDTRSDIYSLGVLLYELLAGSTPFDAKELMASGIDAMRKTIREKEPMRPSTKLSQTLAAAKEVGRVTPCAPSGDMLSPEGGAHGVTRPTSISEIDRASSRRLLQIKETITLLRGDLDWIVMKCLEKDRARRYETANDLAADLKRHLDHEPVVARPPSATYRFQKLVRRNRLALAAASAVVLTLIAGLSFSTWAFLREAAQRSKADAEKTTAQRHLYAANMNLAQQAWEQNNIGRLRQLLEDTQDYPDRGFEWYYWQRQTHMASKTLRGHVSAVNAVAFSPDGQRIVTGSDDQTAKVWEAASGRELLRLKGHTRGINSVAFSPDGQRIVTGSDDQTAKVWEAASGRELLALKGHSASIRSVAFSPDGQQIVTGSEDQTAKVWETASGRELLTLEGHTDRIWSVAFSPDGQRIVTGSWDRTAKVWEAVSGRKLLTLNGHSGFVHSVAFSPDGQRILTGSNDQIAKVWDAASGRELRMLAGHKATIFSVAFSPDGQRILTGAQDQTAKVWEAVSGRELLTLKGHSGHIYSVAFSPDGQRIVTGSVDQTAKVWQAAGSRTPLPLEGHTRGINSVAFSPDGQRIVTGSDDHSAKVWDVASGRELFTLSGYSGHIYSVAFSPSGQRIVTGGWERTARIWESATGGELLSLTGHNDHIYSVAFSPDGQRIVTGSGDHTAKVWEVASGRELLTLRGGTNQIMAVAFTPNGQRIVTCSEDQTAKVWDAVGGRELFTLEGHNVSMITTAGHVAPIGVGYVAISPDGLWIITGSGEQTAKVWEAASGRELFTLKGHSAVIHSVAFSPNGRRIITCSEDQTARVWETVSGRELFTLKGHSAAIRSVAFSPDGQRIVTGSGDRTAKVWEAAPAKQVAAWQEEERTP